jgi:hypothetical protein
MAESVIISLYGLIGSGFSAFFFSGLWVESFLTIDNESFGILGRLSGFWARITPKTARVLPAWVVFCAFWLKLVRT